MVVDDDERDSEVHPRCDADRRRTGALDVDRAWQSGLVFLLGAVVLGGITRTLRHQSLVYGSLAQLTVGVLTLSAWAIDWSDRAYLLGWLAATAALIALALGLTALVARRRGLAEFYAGPCLLTALILTAVAFLGAIDARAQGRQSFRLDTLALAANAVVTMLVARSWRRAELTYIAVFHFVVASYMVILSVGRNDPAMAYVLGLCAVVEALVLWAAGFVCERLPDGWTRQCGRALVHSAVALTALAIPLSDRSSLVFALVGVSFLLMVKSLSAGRVAACCARRLGSRLLLAMAGSACVAPIDGSRTCGRVRAVGGWRRGPAVQAPSVPGDWSGAAGL